MLVVLSRSFSTASRSEIIVSAKFPSLIRKSFINKVSFLGSTCWKESQLDLKNKAEALFNTFSNRISKTFKKIQRKFTFDNIVAMLISLEFFIQSDQRNQKI
jgi:hypothetical protein